MDGVAETVEGGTTLMFYLGLTLGATLGFLIAALIRANDD